MSVFFNGARGVNANKQIVANNKGEEISNMKLMVNVNEIFGPTIQGEGPSTGVRCMFLRVSGCNLTCSWCDTPYTWDWKGQNGEVWDKESETHAMSVYDIIQRLTGSGVKLVVISGGLP